MQDFDPHDPLPDSLQSAEFAFRKAVDWAILVYLVKNQQAEFHDLCREVDQTQVFVSESVKRLEKANMLTMDDESTCKVTEFGTRFLNALIEEFKND